MEYQVEKIHRSSLILVLNNSRFLVNKQQLVNKSYYFASLLSTNFSDYYQEEQFINYQIPYSILQDYINWIHQDLYISLESGRNINLSLEKFKHQALEDLLKLLHLSVLFATDQLTEDIIELIESYWLFPEHVIDIWLVAQDLGFHLLQDISLAACLDYFEALPVEKLLSLTRNEFISLAGNSHVKCTEVYLRNKIHDWISHNNEKISVNEISKRDNKYLYCFVPEDDCEYVNKKIYLYCCDDNQLFEYFTIEYPKEIMNGSELKGMQFTSKGCNLYLCGGEYGIGTGRFNLKIWRYSLLSKKWFCESLMPAPRRHMVATIIKNKLLFVGGTGQYRVKMARIDIYDFYTGIWSTGADLPETFSYVPQHIVLNEKLVIYTTSFSCFYVYYTNENVWLELPSFQSLLFGTLEASCVLPLIAYGIDTCFLDFRKHKSKYVINVVSNKTKCTEGSSCESYMLDYNMFEQCGKTDHFEFYILRLKDRYIYVMSDLEQDPWSFYLHSFAMQGSDKFSSSCSFFPMKVLLCLMDPTDLYTASNIFNCDKNDCNSRNNDNQHDQHSRPSTSRDHQPCNYLLKSAMKRPISCIELPESIKKLNEKSFYFADSISSSYPPDKIHKLN